MEFMWMHFVCFKQPRSLISRPSNVFQRMREKSGREDLGTRLTTMCVEVYFPACSKYMYILGWTLATRSNGNGNLEILLLVQSLTGGLLSQ